ncbi:tyrosine-type recombinase/integrase [Kaistia granuli]|uniref:tyrosine-type recombinase/integrase n=1 Tax=Kaistia granuli TaxID=363259 RepID=UPI00035D5702|nr:tyrosine-type recombinase/integrase [Kaistia granuli]
MTVENDILRFHYRRYMEHAKGYSPKTIDSHLRAIVSFDQFQRGRDFGTITTDQIISFRKHLLEKSSEVTGRVLSASTIVHTLGALKDFFHWLAETGFPKFDRSAIDYFTPPKRTELNARTRPRRPIATPQDVARMIEATPRDTLEGLRDAAVISIVFLTGIRVGALISLKIKHVRPDARQIDQDSDEVQTKFGKNQVTTWFSVGEPYETILLEWLEVRKAAGATDEDPLFPRKHSAFGSHSEEQDTELPWVSSRPINEIFKKACREAGLPYFNPHSIRNTLTRMARTVCRTDEEKKAWSQNLGHKHMRTTDESYGHVDTDRQHELLVALRSRSGKRQKDEALVEAILAASDAVKDAIDVILRTQMPFLGTAS